MGNNRITPEIHTGLFLLFYQTQRHLFTYLQRATLQVDEINKILHERVEQYNRKVGIENIGRIVQVGMGLLVL
jgi:hypothetical protein